MILTFTRKLGKILRGAATSRQIFLGAFLGVLIGMIPGFNLTMLLLILLVILLNANVGIIGLGLALGKSLCYALASVTFQIGYIMIHEVGLESIFATFAETPVLAWMDLQVYCLVGGLPIAIVVGAVLGIVLSQIVTVLRRGIVEATKRNSKMEKLAKNFFVRILLWVVFGKKKRDLEKTLEAKPPLFRKMGVALAAVVIVVLLVGEIFLLDLAAKKALVAALERTNGAEVNVDAVNVSLLGGEVEVKNLQVTDRDRPTHNAWQVKQATADLSVKDLLAKQLVIGRLVADSVKTGTQREKPGRVIEPVEEEEEEKPEDPGEETVEDRLNRYLKKGKQYEDRLKQLKEYLEERRRAQQEEQTAEDLEESKEDLEEQGRESGFHGLSAKHLLARKPLWLIRDVDVKGVDAGESMNNASIAGSNLSSHPELVDGPMSLALRQDDAEQPLAALEFNFQKADVPHKLQLRFTDLPIGDSVQLSDDYPLDIQDGKVAIDAGGEFSLRRIKLPFHVVITGMQAEAGSQEVFGLDPETAKEVFAAIEELKLSGVVEGSLDRVRVKLDTEAALANIKEALKKAGKEALANKVNAEIDKQKEELANRAEQEAKDAVREKLDEKLKEHLGEEAGGQLSKDLEDKLGEGAGDAVKGTIDGLLGKKKKPEGEEKKDEEKKKEEEDGETKKEGAGDFLKKLF